MTGHIACPGFRAYKMNDTIWCMKTSDATVFYIETGYTYVAWSINFTNDWKMCRRCIEEVPLLP
jgi:hypothetical protein